MNWKKVKLISTLCLTIFFMTGLMLMDYGASFKDVPHFYAQTLLFERIEPRVIYHSGLLLALLSFFLSQIIIIDDIV